MNAEELWARFCREKHMDPQTPYEAWAFCGGGAVGDELADLVLAGKKFGTSGAYDDYVAENATDEIPRVGDYSVILKDNGDAVCVIRDYEVYIRPFGDVSPFHAFSEGEGDLSLAYWRKAHAEFFKPGLEENGMTFTDESPIVCEKFSVEYAPCRETDNDELLFVEPSATFANEIAAYRKEMLDADSDFDGCFSMKRREDPEDFIRDCITWSNPRRPAGEHGAWGNVIMAVRKSDGKMVGCFQLHNVLTEWMKQYTGHVGYSVRPSERRKGYAVRLLAKAREFAAGFGFDEINVSCLPDNIGSRKTILANGGEYMETVFFERDGVYLEKYRVGTTQKSAVHRMKLQPEPFAMIKSGKKTIELRLYDKKRQKIKVGDTIEFTDAVSGETLRATVTALHRFDNFAELYRSLPLLSCGYTEETVAEAKPSDMETYYTVVEQEKYGVVGIRLSLS